ncbi:MAG: hypothetical protein FK733_15335 [Asgard group archaeon]|nr:hypothetical protein [Asgard group archaeon]
MVSSKTYSILAWIMIIVGVASAGFGLYEVGFGGRPSYSIPIMVIGFAILIGGIVFYILGERKEKEEKKSRLTTRAAKRSPSIYQEIKEEEEEKSLEELHALKKFAYQRTRIKAIYVPIIPDGHKCMISKLPLASADEILQCPSCKSYFLLDYLVEWVEEHGNCPVCQFGLV